MLKSLSISIILFLVGLLGASFPVFFSRDGSSIIIMGFGACILMIHTRVNEGMLDKKNSGPVIALTIAAALAGIISIIYNGLKFSTNFNKVLTVGFVILVLWEVFLVFAALRSESKK